MVIEVFEVVVLASVLLLFVNDGVLASRLSRRIITECIEDLRVASWIRVRWSLVHDFERIEQPEHHSHFVLADRRCRCKCYLAIWSFNVRQCKYLWLRT